MCLPFVAMKRSTAHFNMRYKHVTALSSATCLSVLLALLLLTRQAKMRYDENKKFHRLQDYAEQVNIVSESLQALEESAQTLEEDVNQLKQVAQDNLEKAMQSSSTTYVLPS